jgi:hypothetical protein
MRYNDATNNMRYYFTTDHLGSTLVTVSSTAPTTRVGEVRSMPWGDSRSSGVAETIL